MNFTKEQLCGLLSNVLSADTELLRVTEQQIKQLNDVQGFTGALIALLFDNNVSQLVQYVATIVLKNHIQSIWRKKNNSIITDQEKEVYRSQFIELLTKFDHQGQNAKISAHLAIIISQIARVDFPAHWPTLFNSLLNLYENGNDTIKKSALTTIKAVVNELASRRFQPDRQSYYQLLDGVKSSGQQLQQQQLEMFIQTHLNSLELLVLVSKILRRVIVNGYTQYQETPEIVDHFDLLFTLLPQLHLFRELIQLLPSDHPFTQNYDQLITVNQKILVKTQTQNPLSFIDFLPKSLVYFNQQIISFNHAKAGVHVFKKSLVQSLTFLKDVVDCTSYQSDMIYDENEDEVTPMSSLAAKHSIATVMTPTIKAQQSIHQFFSNEVLSELLRALVSNYLILNGDELAQWQEDPEQFINDIDSGAETNAYEMKPCSYSLFILLMRHFHEIGVRTVLEMLNYVTSGHMTVDGNQQQQLSTEQILLKEACYMTVGLGYYDLYDNVSFEQLFSNVFMKELQMQDKRYNIIRRRVCWLVGYWIPKIPVNLKPFIINLVLELTSNDDLVIALTAQESLRSYIDDYQTELEDFVPYADRTLLSIFNLSKRVTNVDIKCKLLETLGSVYIKINEKIKPFGNNIMTLVSDMWSNGEAPHHLKSAIVRNLTLFLQALNNDATEFYGFLLPVIEQSTTPDTEESIYLIEDALELWHALIVRAKEFSEPLLKLFGNLLAIIQKTFEHNEMALKILDAYILIGGKQLFVIYGEQIVKIILMLLGDIKDESLLSTMRPIDRVLQVYPVEGAVLLQPVFIKLNCLINGINGGGGGGDEENDQVQETELAIVHYFNIFARLIAMNPLGFFAFMDKYGVAYRPFFDGWFDRIDSIGTSEARKLTAVALSNLLAVQRTEVAELISPIVTIVVGLRADIDPIDLSLISFSEDGLVLPETSLVDINLKIVSSHDPVNTVDMSTYLINKMKESSTIHQSFNQQIQQIHPTVLQLAFPQQ
ncbi:hypothetical protein PPL_07324 [Heterostelium album PN500]|uniref:Importin N-terminal domain-containing protein n=1 Tax=Heterostelium pallidum (strain ATCC 26659 / Pp 5 / PN500) TaxID=670386 RepID=D3BF07_HETP5|nr:hypothetical protein PPL_07324 [Heterostelium album PN500]EFA80488.1 hypothetical protein PPL_07324 [Heterostelium album PN500]|eukprot:XP_020432608.1 hypothetical protein PPL_07324 [Heterostelium album PN500]